MKAAGSKLLLSSAALIVAGCVAPYDIPSLTRHAADVKVLSTENENSSGCRFLGRISVVDGNIESSKGYMYQGTRERALIRIRNEAAAKGGNAVAIEDEGPVLMVDGPEAGQYYIKGRALQCASAVRPNTRVNPPHSVVTALAQGGKRRAAGRAVYREH